jgi:formylglycine-generating enzyme required for sulfatase activity
LAEADELSFGKPPKPKPNPGPFPILRRTNSLGQVFVTVPRTETLFCIWDTRVRDFEAFAAATGYDAAGGMFSLSPEGWKPQGGSWRNPGFPQGPDHPVVGVCWNDANAFCRWLTQTERAKGLIGRAESYRLPTDWEWGVAVGFRQREDGAPYKKHGKYPSVFPWGSRWPPPPGAGNYAGTEVRAMAWPEDGSAMADYSDGYARTSPVGSFGTNRFGLFDMGGNAWQWCEDFYNGRCGARVLRGGAWSSGREEACSSCREYDMPSVRMNNFGFRVILASP